MEVALHKGVEVFARRGMWAAAQALSLLTFSKLLSLLSLLLLPFGFSTSPLLPSSRTKRCVSPSYPPHGIAIVTFDSVCRAASGTSRSF